MSALILLLAQLGCARPDDDGDVPASPDSGDADSADTDTGAPCDPVAWLPDADGDSYGDSAGMEAYACEQPPGYALEGGDCDDAEPAVNPGAAERCDTVQDDDCDAAYNEDGAADCTDRWLDEDHDGYGGDGRCMCPIPEEVDTGIPAGDGFGEYTATVGGDCDDTDPLHTLDCTTPNFEDPADAGARLVCDTSECAMAAVGDADADGNPDVAFSPQDGTVVVAPVPLAGDAGVWSTALGTTDDWNDTVEGFADLDGTPGDELVTATSDCELSDDGSSSSCELHVRAWSGADLSVPSTSFVGPLHGGIVSNGAAVVGDIDADGRDDVLAWNAQSWSEGQVWWPPLGGDADVTSDDLTPLFEDVWRGVHGPGDLDGDGVDDLVVETLSSGAVVFDGPIPSVLAAADGRATVTGLDGQYWYWVAAGDLDGDGRADLVVRDLGDVYVLEGPVADGTLTDLAVATLGSAGSANHLSAADASGDADGDGRVDLLFGVQNSDAGGADAGGLAGLVHGPLAGAYEQLDADVLWAGSEEHWHLGGRVAFAGDLDDDGASELLVGGLWDTGAGRVGATYLFAGR